MLVLALGLFLIRKFGITGGYHRYFSHRSYKTSRWFQFVLAWLGGMSAQKGALWWAAYHRHHHQHSDQPEDIQDEIIRINTDARPIALQVALLIPFGAALIGLGNSFRMRRIPDPVPSGGGEPMTLG